MTYEKLVAKVKTAYAKADASKITEHVAIQVNVSGEAEGIFYIEITDGKVVVEPYDYYDHDMILFGGESDLVAIATGKMSIDEALNDGKVSVAGPNIEKGLSIREVVVKKAPAKKTTAKKTTAKKTTAKSETKAPAKKTTAKAEANAPAKKAEAKAEVKAPAKKAEAKVEVKAAETKPVVKEAAKAETKAPAKKAEAKAPAKKATAKKTK